MWVLRVPDRNQSGNHLSKAANPETSVPESILDSELPFDFCCKQNKETRLMCTFAVCLAVAVHVVGAGGQTLAERADVLCFPASRLFHTSVFFLSRWILHLLLLFLRSSSASRKQTHLHGG